MVMTRPFRESKSGEHSFPLDACRLAQRRDALIRWRALFEPGELVRSASARPSPQISPNWASLALSTFAETKVDRLPGRNPASIMGNTTSMRLTESSQHMEMSWNNY